MTILRLTPRAAYALGALALVVALTRPSTAQETSCVLDSATEPDATLRFQNPTAVPGDPDRFSIDLVVDAHTTFDLGALTFIYRYNDDALDFESVSFAPFVAENPCYATLGSNTDNGLSAIGLFLDPRIADCSPSDGTDGSPLSPEAGPVVIATAVYTIADAAAEGALTFLASEVSSDENQTCWSADSGMESAPLAVSVEHDEVDLVEGYRLSRAYPNPFNPRTQLELEVSEAQEVVVSVYDAMGRRVAELYRGRLGSRMRQAMVWEAGVVPSGVYFIRAVGELFVATERVTLLK